MDSESVRAKDVKEYVDSKGNVILSENKISDAVELKNGSEVLGNTYKVGDLEISHIDIVTELKEENEPQKIVLNVKCKDSTTEEIKVKMSFVTVFGMMIGQVEGTIPAMKKNDEKEVTIPVTKTKIDYTEIGEITFEVLTDTAVITE